MSFKQFSVNCKKRWQNTEVYVPANTEVRVSRMSGEWFTHPGRLETRGGGYKPIGGEGYLVPSAHEAALVAKIQEGQNATVAEIGESGTIRAAHPGLLYLSCNDEKFSDNDGVLNVGVNVAGPPAAPPAAPPSADPSAGYYFKVEYTDGRVVWIGPYLTTVEAYRDLKQYWGNNVKSVTEPTYCPHRP